MAKRKHGKRHRRVGASKLNAGSPVVKLLAVGAGFLLEKYVDVNGMILRALPAKQTITPTSNTTGVNPMYETALTVGEIGLGGYLLLSKKKASVPKVIIGGVLAGMGVHNALKKAGVINGYQSVPVIGRRKMAGYKSVPVIGNTPAQLASVPGQLQGYKVNGYTSQGSGVLGNVRDNEASETGSGLAYAHSGYMN